MYHQDVAKPYFNTVVPHLSKISSRAVKTTHVTPEHVTCDILGVRISRPFYIFLRSKNTRDVFVGYFPALICKKNVPG